MAKGYLFGIRLVGVCQEPAVPTELKSATDFQLNCIKKNVVAINSRPMRVYLWTHSMFNGTISNVNPECGVNLP